jgi:ADP-ribosyl-[dinitrogen reductase] hydrolase
MTPREIEASYGVHSDIRGGGWLKLKPGQVTDDTTMSLALGQAILEAGEVDPNGIAEAFSQWMSNKPVDIGHTVRRGIVQYRLKGTTQMPPNEYDGGNGACMRTLPIALVTWGSQPPEIQTKSRLHAHITHHNALSDAATECIIDMIHKALEGVSLSHLEAIAWQLVDTHSEFRFDGKHCDNPSGFIVETFQAVMQALTANDNFSEAMIDVVNRGGDADTTGAILGMVAGTLYGLSAIPKEWQEKLDKKVMASCQQQAEALLRLSPGFQHQGLEAMP